MNGYPKKKLNKITVNLKVKHNYRKNEMLIPLWNLNYFPSDEIFWNGSHVVLPNWLIQIKRNHAKIWNQRSTMSVLISDNVPQDRKFVLGSAYLVNFFVIFFKSPCMPDKLSCSFSKLNTIMSIVSLEQS